MAGDGRRQRPPRPHAISSRRGPCSPPARRSAGFCSRAPPGTGAPGADEREAPARRRRDARRQPHESPDAQAERERQRRPRPGAEAREASRRRPGRRQPPRARPPRRRHPERGLGAGTGPTRTSHTAHDGDRPTRKAATPPPEVGRAEHERRWHPTGHPVNARRAAGDDGGPRGELADRPRDSPEATRARSAAARDANDARGLKDASDGRDGRWSRHGERGE